MEYKVYNQSGKPAGKFDLPESVFGLPWNADLVHQVAVSMRSNQRHNKAESLDRGAVSGGGKKPWRQKGTGRARHGSIRSPIWRGGGATHGPTTERNYYKKINKKMRAKALAVVLSQKLRDNELLLVDNLAVDGKTKSAQTILNSLAGVTGFEKLNFKTGRRALVAVPTRSVQANRSFRNIPSATVTEVRNLNPLELLNYKYIVLADPEASLKTLTTRYESK